MLLISGEPELLFGWDGHGHISSTLKLGGCTLSLQTYC